MAIGSLIQRRKHVLGVKLILLGRALRTDLHSAVLLGGEDGNKAGNKELLKRLYNICH